MIDVAIVGAGLTGLTLALRLQEQGVSVAVYEARMRPGGRIHTDQPQAGGAAIDLGASWYWPETEPRITALITSLGLKSFAQPDQGQVLHLADGGQAPQVMEATSIHGGARRLSGGMNSLVAQLQARLTPDTVKLGHKLLGVFDAETHVDLQLSHKNAGVDQLVRVQAKRIVLALPPRLIAQHIRFQPELSGDSMQALQQVSTWMAREAKAVARFERPFWLEQGQSGSAFVTHSQAVLREIWDASDEHGAALAGFCAMAPDTRAQFDRSLPLLTSSQFAQLFGPLGHAEDVVIADWSKEPWTCSDLDKQDQQTEPPQADPLLRRPHWSGRLFFGGTETARQAAGHMEGALESAARLVDYLKPARRDTKVLAINDQAALQAFSNWVTAERRGMMPRYKQHLNHMLSRQDQDRVTQRAMLATVEQTYTQALEQLAALEWRPVKPTTDGRSEHTPQILATFSGFSKALVDEALVFNATSCALSNFAYEHRPDADYMRAITADLAAAWREFAWATNDLLCTRGQLVN
jgi:monoamine oxidase